MHLLLAINLLQCPVKPSDHISVNRKQSLSVCCVSLATQIPETENSTCMDWCLHSTYKAPVTCMSKYPWRHRSTEHVSIRSTENSLYMNVFCECSWVTNPRTSPFTINCLSLPINANRLETYSWLGKTCIPWPVSTSQFHHHLVSGWWARADESMVICWWQHRLCSYQTSTDQQVALLG